MKYIIKPINDDFIFEELDVIRKRFIEALNYTMESATVYFDTNAKDDESAKRLLTGGINQTRVEIVASN